MLQATLLECERNKPLSEINEPRATQLRAVMAAYPYKGREELPIHYVPDDRDMSCVQPIQVPKYHVMDRDILQPLLDALERGDVELAVALTPGKHRLCGYRVVEEAFEYTKWGSYAADIETVLVEPGIYPIFAEEFQYHERERTYTNEVKTYPGICVWYDGVVTSDNLRPQDVGSSDTVFSSPYAYDIASSALTPPSPGRLKTINLIYPFAAREEHHEASVIDGKPYTTYSLIDASLPDLLPKGVNPIRLRNGGADLKEEKTDLSSALFDAQSRAAAQSESAAQRAVPGHTQGR